jgi:hypothetical protein
MTKDDVRHIFALQGVHGDPAHIAAAASGVRTLLEGTAERFARLPLEAEPANFVAEERAKAP